MWQETKAVSGSAESNIVSISATVMSSLTGMSSRLLALALVSLSLSTEASVPELEEAAAQDTRQMTCPALVNTVRTT